MDANTPKDPLTILNTVFDYPSFRSRQEEIIDNVLAGKNTLAILPTGAGKSLCFQIPALIFDGLTVVVSPLIALMKDQVDGLKKKGVLDVAYINSILDQSTKERIYEQLKSKQSKLKMLYVAPETFVDNKLMSVLKSCNISLIAIDEVHCISVWGHNFRPDYLRLKKIIRELNNPPILGLTATATKTVEGDIQVQLGVKCDTFNDSFDRKNLLFSVLTLKSNIRKEEFLKGVLEKLKGSIIVYVNFTKTAEELAGYLSNEGLSASFYHGQMEKEKRKKVQNDFMSGETRIVIATSAFGMGIDKEDIRGIIHFNLPKSIENYYQEVGRAGRDGNISNCILLYSGSDEIKLRKLIRYNTPSRKQIKAVLDFLMNRVGGGSGLIYVNAKQLAYDLGLDEVPVRLMLHHLEEKEAIRTHFKIFRRAKIRSNDTDLDGREEVERVVRSGYFIENKWMDLEALSAALGMSIQKLNWILRDLKAAGKIELVERDVCIPVEIKPGLWGIDVEEIRNAFLELERSGLEKIDRVVECVNSGECRRKFILNYFSEDYTQPCNACDVCNPFLKLEEGIKAREMEFVDKEVIEELKNLRIAHEDDVETTVLKSVVLLNGIRYSWLVSVLLGYDYISVRREGLNGVECYGMLKGKLSKGELGRLIDKMVIDGLLLKTIDTELFITGKGVAYIKKHAGGIELEGVELDILNILRAINKPIYKTNISRLLVGSLKANSLCEKYKLRKYFGHYNYLTQKEIRKRVEHLVELGYLAKMEKSVKASPVFLSDKGKASVNRTEECLVEKVWRKDDQSGLGLSTKESGAETSRHPLPWTLGESKDPKAIPQLIEFTKSADGNERRLAASALGKLSTFKPQIFEAVSHLIRLLDDEKPQVRQYAAKALGKIESEDAMHHLKKRLNDEMPYVREAATAAIKRIKKEKEL